MNNSFHPSFLVEYTNLLVPSRGAFCRESSSKEKISRRNYELSPSYSHFTSRPHRSLSST